MAYYFAPQTTGDEANADGMLSGGINKYTKTPSPAPSTKSPIQIAAESVAAGNGNPYANGGSVTSTTSASIPTDIAGNQKVISAVQKAESSPTPTNLANAAKQIAIAQASIADGATTKTIKAAGSAASAAVKSSIANLKDSQKTEVKLLNKTGEKAAAATEKVANTNELNNYLSYVKSNLGKPQVGLLSFFNQGIKPSADGKSFVDATGKTVGELAKPISAASTYDGSKSAAYTRLNAAYDLADKYNLAGPKAIQNGQTGMTLLQLDTANQKKLDHGTYGAGPLGKTLDAVSSWSDLTKVPEASVIAASNGKIHSVKETPGLFYVSKGDSTGSDKNFNRMYFTKNADGSYNYVSGTKTFIDTPDKPGGLLGGLSMALQVAAFVTEQPWLATIANVASAANAIQNKDILGLALSGLSLGGYNVGGELGKVIASGATPAVQAALGNAIIGAAKNKENPFLGAVTSAAGSYLGNAWKLSGGDWDKFTLLASNGVDAGEITQADFDSHTKSAVDNIVKTGLQDQIDAGKLSIADANTAYASQTGVDVSTLTDTFVQPGTIVDNQSGITTTDLNNSTLTGGTGNDVITGNVDTKGDAVPAGVPNGAQNIGGGFYTADGKLYDTVNGTQTALTDQGGGDAIDYPDLGSWTQKLIDSNMDPKVAAAVAAATFANGGTISDITDIATSYGTGTSTVTNGTTTNTDGTTKTTTTGTKAFDWSDPSTYPWGTIAGVGANWLGSYLNSEAAGDAAKAQAAAQVAAAQIAADAAKFRPVGVKTAFGESKFEFDPTTGYLNKAGYTLDPTIKAQQDKLMAESGDYLTQYLGADAATKPMGEAAAGLMTLGKGYLATTPQEQAAKYMAEQNALLDPGNEAELAALQNRLQAQGRLGLSMGGAGGLMSSNPEMAAYQNKLEMQKRQLAAAATQGGMDYAKYGAGLVGTGGSMLQDMYKTQQAAYQPYNTAIGGAQYLEGLGQQSMDMGVNLGKTATAANAQAGLLTSQGMQNAANITGQQAQQAGSMWGNLLQGGANAFSQYQNQQAQQQQQQQYNQMLQAIIAGKSTGVQ